MTDTLFGFLHEPSGTGSGYSLTLGGCLETLVGAGIEVVAERITLTLFQAQRGIPGTSGTTTVELELNGVATGYTLSWLSSDPAFTLKTLAITLPVVAGDRISFSVTSVEVAAEDIYAKVSA